MFNLLIIVGFVTLVFYLVNLLGKIRKRGREILIANAFVAGACLLIGFSYSSCLAWKAVNLKALCFDFGIATFLVAVFIMFIHMMKDPVFKYSPYVAIIGLSLLTMYANIVVSIG